jgi:hypothetical protein
MSADTSEPAVERLRGAIDSLESVLERRVRVGARRADSDEELAIMQDDRSRLAVELDAALADNRALAAAGAAAAERIAKVRAAIEEMLRAEA